MSDLIPLSVLLAIIQNQTNNAVGELKNRNRIFDGQCKIIRY